ncbi:MAG: phosphatidylglycerophosphatase A [Deltaproteobacteria bacterium]|nr:phosphatidylglycerophosphatase A [Deltaproteobacteria bacterium]
MNSTEKTEKSGGPAGECRIKRAFVIFFATGTGLGYSPLIPGTLGTIWGVAISFPLSTLPVAARMASILALIALAIFFSQEAKGLLGGGDPKEIVCDEAAGFTAASFMVPHGAGEIILVFILFRIFDILKPFPIGLIERRIPGGAGIVLDDVMAGIYANISARIIIGFVL